MDKRVPTPQQHRCDRHGSGIAGAAGPSCVSRESDRGETRTGHHKENLATETGPLSSLGVCSEPGTAGTMDGGRAPGPSADDSCADNPN